MCPVPSIAGVPIKEKRSMVQGAIAYRKINAVNDVQSIKALLPIDVTLGRSIVFNDVHPLNALSPIDVALGKLIVVNDVQPLNAL